MVRVNTKEAAIPRRPDNNSPLMIECGTELVICHQLGCFTQTAPFFGCAFIDFWDAYQAVILKEQDRSIDKGEDQNYHVKRLDKTLRQRLVRFTRKTLLVLQERPDA